MRGTRSSPPSRQPIPLESLSNVTLACIRLLAVYLQNGAYGHRRGLQFVVDSSSSLIDVDSSSSLIDDWDFGERNPADLPDWLDDSFYATKIQPLLKKVPIGPFSNTWRLANTHAYRFVKGARIPYRRHWLKMAELVGGCCQSRRLIPIAVSSRRFYFLPGYSHISLGNRRVQEVYGLLPEAPNVPSANFRVAR